MKYYQIAILLFLITSCKTKYEGIKRTEIQVDFRQNSKGKPNIMTIGKCKIEYRIYDKDLKLIELIRYGGQGDWNSIAVWNPKESKLAVINASFQDFKRRDFIEVFEYDDTGMLKERKLWRYKNNKIDYLAFRDIFDVSKAEMKCEVLDYYGEIERFEKKEIKYPPEIQENAFEPKIGEVVSKMVDAEREEFIYDKEDKLVKIIYKDRLDNPIGYTIFEYEKMKKVK